MKSYRDFMRNPPARPAIVAHRGAWQTSAENTIASIEQAISEGFEIVEIDVQQSADDVLFLLHDDDLNRMAGLDRRASDLNMDDLGQVHLRSGDGSGDQTPGPLTILTLRDALRAARSRVYLDVDVKHPELMEATAALIAAEGMSGQVDIKIDVQTRADADRLRHLEAEHGAMVMPKTTFEGHTADPLIDLLHSLDVAVVEAEFDRLDTIATRAATFRAAGISIWVNTLDPVACCGMSDTNALADPDAIWGALLAAGISVIQTDAPADLAAYRSQRIAAQ